jgi:hypothetical protein
MPALWLWPNLFSLDAPLIASLWQNQFAQDAGVRLSLASRLVLPATVWLIYLLDRLLDTADGVPLLSTARHEFCRANRPLCCVLAAIAATTSALSVLYLSPHTFRNGLAVLAAVASYLLAVHGAGSNVRRWLPKEVAVGLIFSIGSVLAPLSWSPNPSRLILPAVVFGVLCWTNSSAIEVWEGGTVDAFSDWIVRHLDTVSIAVCVLCAFLAVCFPVEHAWAALLFSSLGFCVVARSRRVMDANLLRVMIDLPLVAPLFFIR